jgi:hypothetical protein
VQRFPPLGPTMDQVTPVYIFTSYFFNINVNIIFPSPENVHNEQLHNSSDEVVRPGIAYMEGTCKTN